jgi:hypothetical protein
MCVCKKIENGAHLRFMATFTFEYMVMATTAFKRMGVVIPTNGHGPHAL